MAKRMALGVAVAMAFFVLVEGILWAAGVVPLHDRSDPLVGFAGWSPLFVQSTAPGGEPVFTTAAGKLRWFNPQRFAARKPEGVTRVFCVGGSTTYGRPYDDRTSFCGWLREFLPAVEPGRRWEVVNAGGISYASYRVARVMRALADREPDLFIVYTGHNEFLEERTYGGLMDVPEVVRDMGSLASRLRLYSVLSDAVSRKDVLSTEVDAVLDRSVGPEAYHRDDELRDHVIGHFRISLERMTRIGSEAGARMIFVTPASNLGDFSPFKSEPAAGLSGESIERVRRLKQAAEDEDPAGALALIDQALAIDSRDADLLYARGVALRALGRTEEAFEAFVASRDEDVAPLRALTPMKQIVVDVARKADAGLVDFERMVRERSPDGIPGKNLFMDHVHPTIEGNRILALALVDEMIRTGAVDPAPAWNESAITAITERVRAGVDEKAAELARRSLANVLIWAGKEQEAEHLVDRSMADSSGNAETLFQKATLLVREGRFDEALPFLEDAVAAASGNAAIRKEHGAVLAELGRNAEAREELETAARLDPDLAGVHYELGLVLESVGELRSAEDEYRAELARYPDHSDACNNLGILLAMRGVLDEAEELFERAVRADPSNRNAADNLAQARAMLKQ